jgi:hypothetical protein
MEARGSYPAISKILMRRKSGALISGSIALILLAIKMQKRFDLQAQTDLSLNSFIIHHVGVQSGRGRKT